MTLLNTQRKIFHFINLPLKMHAHMQFRLHNLSSIKSFYDTRTRLGFLSAKSASTRTCTSKAVRLAAGIFLHNVCKSGVIFIRRDRIIPENYAREPFELSPYSTMVSFGETHEDCSLSAVCSVIYVTENCGIIRAFRGGK